MSRPVTRTLDADARRRVRDLLASRGHALRTNPRNRYIDFEARTEGRSIFTLYTSGKLVSTVREGDGEGLLVEDAIAAVCGPPPSRSPASGGPIRPLGTPSRPWMAGIDETGTGELLGTVIVGGAWLPERAAEAAAAVAGHVETKSSRAASGWESLGGRLLALREAGLVVTALSIPNALFDACSKNGLLDLAVVRIAGDLLAAGPVGEDDPGAVLARTGLVLDDYGTGALVASAATAWRRRGIEVAIETRADDRHLAARVASVFARSVRARQMAGLAAEVDDGPLGTGNAGHRDTLRWLRRRAAARGPWPSFVKTSFKTVRELDGLPPVQKERVPAVNRLLDEDGVSGFLAGRLDVGRAGLWLGPGERTRSLVVDREGRLLVPERCPAHPFLPLLFGGLVLDRRRLDPEGLDAMLDRERGLLSGWRVLVGPREDADDPVLVALARAHARGVLHVVPTAHEDPLERAVRHAALLVRDERPRRGGRSSAPEEAGLTLQVRAGPAPS